MGTISNARNGNDTHLAEHNGVNRLKEKLRKKTTTPKVRTNVRYSEEEIKQLEMRVLTSIISSEKPGETLGKWRSAIDVTQEDLAADTRIILRVTLASREVNNTSLTHEETRRLVSSLVKIGASRDSIFLDNLRSSINESKKGSRANLPRFSDLFKEVILEDILGSNDTEKRMEDWCKALNLTVLPTYLKILLRDQRGTIQIETLNKFVNVLFESSESNKGVVFNAIERVAQKLEIR